MAEAARAAVVPRRAARRVGPSPLSGPVGLVLGALAVSRVIYWQRGLRFDVGFVGSAMQVADWDLLRREPLSTAWYLHLQPPLFNLFVGAGANVFGSWAGLGFQAVYLLATVAMLVAFVHLCLDLGISARMTTVLGIVLAVSPTIAQYESLLFYAHLEVVLLVLAARSLQRWCLNRSGGSLAAFTTALCCLALGRSLYHPVWFLGLGVLLVLAARRTLPRRALVGAVALPLLCGVAIGAKNAAVFGWWTTSSLEGINLHRVSEPYLTDAERARLIEDGTITEVSEDAFSCGRPADRQSSSGPDRAIPVLDREWRKADRRVANLNNRHQLQCLEALRNESIRVVVRAPDAYLRAVGRAATVASYNAVPDVRTRVGNQRALRGPGRIEATLLGSIAPAPGPFDRSYGIVQPQRMQWVLVLAALVVPLYLASLLFARLRARAAAPDTPVLAFMLYVALTGVVLSQLTEVGENNRLILVSWPMLLAGAGLLVTNVGRHDRSTSPALRRLRSRGSGAPAEDSLKALDRETTNPDRSDSGQGSCSSPRVELIATLSLVADLVSAPDNQGSMLVADPAVFARMHRRLSAAERSELAQAYGGDQTVMVLADRFGISRTTVLKVLHDEGIELPYRKMGPTELEEAHRLYESGWSFARVGARLRVDPKTVHNAFRRAGLPTRPRVGR